MKTYTIAHDEIKEGIDLLKDNDGLILFLGQNGHKGRQKKVLLDKYNPAKVVNKSIKFAYPRNNIVKDKNNAELFNYTSLAKPNINIGNVLVRINTSSPIPAHGYWHTIHGQATCEVRANGCDVINNENYKWYDDLVIMEPLTIIKINRGEKSTFIHNRSGSLRIISREETESIIPRMPDELKVLNELDKLSLTT